MINKTEAAERQYLVIIINKIKQAIEATDKAVRRQADDLKESKVYLYENKADMDHAEKVSVRQSITQMAIVGEGAVEKKKRLFRLLQIPYFGRIDFTPEGEGQEIPIYIGVHSLLDAQENLNLVHDWRAPVSGMFYDFELGGAHFESPAGQTEGHISLKRQYRIRNGRLEYMLESAVNIMDDILQQELKQASSDKMRNIVATIQREQNAIIRNDKSRVLIIQGVAGSGKTSIALHRIAFLLYRFKESIRSEDILVLSPNKVFSYYISNVLPELGEERVQETGMEELAATILTEKVRFQTFYQQVSDLLNRSGKSYIERIRFKASAEFLRKLDAYVVHLENEGFQPHDIVVKRYPIPAWFLEEKFKAYHRLPILKRFNEVVREVVANVFFYYKYEVSGPERAQIKREVEKMFASTNLRVLYKGFYDWMAMPEMLKLQKGSVYEYADVYPLIYLKLRLEGIQTFEKVKHLVVDEMQDYTPVQYEVLSRLFLCNKTILGDINQAVNPYSASGLEHINHIFSGADTMVMRKSYRSTFEITEFTRQLGNRPDVEAMERYGEAPQVSGFKTLEEEHNAIRDEIGRFRTSGFNSFGIICRTQEDAAMLFGQVSMANDIDITLLHPGSMAFASGIVITTAHLAKGLEFDQVLVPYCNSDQYHTETDKQILYVACTRAMHRLMVTYTGKPSKLLPGE